MKKIKLYDYQQEMLRRIVEALTVDKGRGMFFDKMGRKVKRGNSVMVQMPTGTGKTVVMAAVVKWFLDSHDGDVWIVAHRKELVDERVGLIIVDEAHHAIGKDQVRYLKELLL